MTLIFLALYSTIFSGIWLVLALKKHRFGKRISTSGGMPPGTATLLFAGFAKSIELSFVTVFVAFLGQVLSRRAFMKDSKGINISEMTMRSWVMQPGMMITHWETIWHAGVSYLGAIAVVGALVAMLYTTASDGLGKMCLPISMLRSVALA